MTNMFQISVATYCSQEEGGRLIRKRAEDHFQSDICRLESALRDFVRRYPRVPFDEVEIASDEYGFVEVRRKHKPTRANKRAGATK